MWTQRDQLQAHQFMRRRLVSAVQTGDANNPVSPSRRPVICYAVGAICALLVTAGFGIYGVLRPGANQNWRKPGQVVIEKETGAAYVLGADGLLHPVLNYTSARLLAGGGGTATVTVSARSLTGVARGVPLGIPGAPDSLPAPDRLVTGPWAVCSTVGGSVGGSGQASIETTAMVGVPVTGTTVGQQEALLVSETPGGARYAIVGGRRLRIRDTAAAVALGYDRTTPTPVTPSWLSAVPPGPDLAVIAIPDSGRNGPRLGSLSTLVGQVLVVESVGSENRYYAVRGSGLDVVTETEAALILGNLANRSAYPTGIPRAIPVSAAEIAGKQPNDRPTDGYPGRVPRAVPVPGTVTAVCAVSDGAEQVAVRLTNAAPLPAGTRAVPAQRGARDARTADAVLVPPSFGALVSDRQSPAADNGTSYLLTDQGMRYPIGGTDAAKALGYGNVRPTPLASTLLTLFPLGVSLDVASAQRVATQ
jgi:type VII secretion protein EccB